MPGSHRARTCRIGADPHSHVGHCGATGTGSGVRVCRVQEDKPVGRGEVVVVRGIQQAQHIGVVDLGQQQKQVNGWPAPAVGPAQLAHLIEAAGRPNVTVQVIPFATGWHPALHGMFNIFRFPDQEMPDIVYSEALTSAYYLNKPEETAKYTEALDRMSAQAASPEQTVSILRVIMKET